MWYNDAHKWDPEGYSPFIDGVFRDPAAAEAMVGFSEDHAGLIEGRCHGNPFFDTGNIGREDNTAVKRAENDAYRANDEAGGALFEFERMFKELPVAQQYVQGSFYIIDIDDPELVEHGEAYINEQLTSHLAEPMAKPREEWEPWMVYVYDDYMTRLFVENLAYGFVPGPIIVEPERQRMGLPYEWFGARID